MTRSPEVSALVSALVGRWSGEGDGKYPTIESFHYREETTFTARPDHPALLFEQQTWKETPAGEEPSHWETGLLRLGSDWSVKFMNAQGGRAEAMTGTWAAHDGGWRISLASNQYAGDDRVISASREFRLADDRLTYVMSMETTATDLTSVHLEAALTKSD